MRLVLDAGALVAVDRDDRKVRALLAEAVEAGVPVQTSAAVVGQVWRGGPRQARLARVLRGVRVVSLEEDDGRRIGLLLAATGSSDVVDAHVVLDAADGDVVLASDPHDIRRALDALGVRASVVRV
jgi:hypothetical protein